MTVAKLSSNGPMNVASDTKRDPTGKNVRNRRAEVEHHLLDHGLLRVGHLSGPEYEVVSMAQAVALSDWAQQFIEIAKDKAPEEFGGDPQELKYWTGMREADGTGWATSRFVPKAGEPGSE